MVELNRWCNERRDEAPQPCGVHGPIRIGARLVHIRRIAGNRAVAVPVFLSVSRRTRAEPPEDVLARSLSQVTAGVVGLFVVVAAAFGWQALPSSSGPALAWIWVRWL